VTLTASEFRTASSFSGRLLTLSLGAASGAGVAETLNDLGPVDMKEILAEASREDALPVVAIRVAVDVAVRRRQSIRPDHDMDRMFEYLCRSLEPWEGPGLDERAAPIASAGPPRTALLGATDGPVRMDISVVPSGDAVRIALAGC